MTRARPGRPFAALSYEGKSAYSSLAVLPDKTVACLYERGEGRYSENLYLARFTLDWLTAGADALP